MSRAGSIFAVILALAIAVVAVPLSPQAAPDPDGAALTEYLHNHRLPAVGAQITVGEDGARSVMLYGFVATQQGFSHAEERTRNYLHDPYVRITNRIKIEPELLALHRKDSQSAPSADSSQAVANLPPPVVQSTSPPADVGDIQQYQAQNQYNDPYGMQGQSSVMTGSTLLIPLIGGLITYGALSGFGSPYYSSPPSYYYRPPPPIYHNRPPPPPRHHRRYHGNPFPSAFSAPPPARSYTPPPVIAAPAHPRYVPPSSFSSSPPVTRHWYSGGYHGSNGGAPPAFGGGFHGGGFHGGHR